MSNFNQIRYVFMFSETWCNVYKRFKQIHTFVYKYMYFVSQNIPNLA